MKLRSMFSGAMSTILHVLFDQTQPTLPLSSQSQIYQIRICMQVSPLA